MSTLEDELFAYLDEIYDVSDEDCGTAQRLYIDNYLEHDDFEDENFLMHYGMPRRSGRYPWGSGKNPYQHGIDFMGRVEKLKKEGWTETPENIKREFGMSTTRFRAEYSIAKDDVRMYNVARAKSMKKHGKGDTEIGRALGVRESTVRSWLNSESEARMKKARNAADFIEEQIHKRGMIDISAGTELELNISRENLNKAIAILESRGYPVYSGRMEQVNNKGNWTTTKVACPPGTKHKEIYDLENVHSLKEYITRDDGETFEKKFHYPEALDFNRLQIVYKEDGGERKDGIIELRRNVPDLSLGESRYSQVRIMVNHPDGKKYYLKGMAVYADDLPDGVDVRFNSNKTKDKPMDVVLKKIKDDPDNPFGSAIKDVEQGGQYWYDDPKSGKRKLGLINKRADEGDWSDWKDALPSQFLSKQSLSLAKQQLKLALADKKDEYEDIMAINNPTIRKYYLSKFADECDAASVNLQAAALPGQKYHTIIPINSLKTSEVYAPQYENGTKLALIRYPHGGTFEIPILTVNNKNKDAIKLLGADVPDAVGINHKVASILSGADFDGDTVMCIPTHDEGGKVKITNRPPLKGLENFDSKNYQYDKVVEDAHGEKHYYRDGREFKVMTKHLTQIQMGIASNLICDMTLKGANDEELAAAVRHSMVVIDAEKHKLDYKQSEVDNNIAALKQKYQDGGGASTLISRSKGDFRVDKRQGSPHINTPGKPWYDSSRPEGALIYTTSTDLYHPDNKYDKKTGTMTIRTADGKRITYNTKDWETAAKYYPVKQTSPDGSVKFTNGDGTIEYAKVKRQDVSTRMAETDDATTLISSFDTKMERAYASYANSLKAMANESRKEFMATPGLKYDSNAAKVYSEEVQSLKEKLRIAQLNAPREREAERRANADIASAEKNNPNISKEDLKKLGQRSLKKYRQEVGSVARRDRSIKISDREWEAIQAGAISDNQLTKILNNSDADSLRDRATPRTQRTLSDAKKNRIKAMRASNYTLEQIAKQLGIPPSTVYEYAKGVK